MDAGMDANIDEITVEIPEKNTKETDVSSIHHRQTEEKCQTLLWISMQKSEAQKKTNLKKS